jgi:hypothetical protein
VPKTLEELRTQTQYQLAIRSPCLPRPPTQKIVNRLLELNDSRSHLVDNEPNFTQETGQQHRVAGPGIEGVSVTVSEAVPESYFNPGLYRIKCELCVRLVGLCHANYVVVLDWFGLDQANLLSFCGVGENDEVEQRYSGCCGLQKPVFVSIGELSKNSQERRKEGMTTFVRLDTLNCVNHGLAQTRKTPPVVSIHKEGGRVNDDEGHLFNIGGELVSRLVLRNRVDEVIESRTQVVNKISNNQRPSQRIGLGPVNVDGDSNAGVVGASFDGERIVPALYPGLDFRVENFEVLFSAV